MRINLKYHLLSYAGLFLKKLVTNYFAPEKQEFFCWTGLEFNYTPPPDYSRIFFKQSFTIYSNASSTFYPVFAEV